MARSTEDQLDEAVVRVVDLAQEAAGGELVAFTVDFQASGEYPYRLLLQDDTHPLIGLARGVPYADLSTPTRAGVTEDLNGSVD